MKAYLSLSLFSTGGPIRLDCRLRRETSRHRRNQSAIEFLISQIEASTSYRRKGIFNRRPRYPLWTSSRVALSFRESRTPAVRFYLAKSCFGRRNSGMRIWWLHRGCCFFSSALFHTRLRGARESTWRDVFGLARTLRAAHFGLLSCTSKHLIGIANRSFVMTGSGVRIPLAAPAFLCPARRRG